MKLDENKKLTLTEEELGLVKKANMMSSPSIAGLMLRNSVKRNTLEEEIDNVPELNFFIECIVAYRKKNYEII